MKYLFLLAGALLIAWAAHGIRKESKRLSEQESRAAARITAELQALAEALTDEMEAEAAKLRALVAEAKQAQAPPVRAEAALNVVPYPDPASRRERAEPKHRRAPVHKPAADKAVYEQVLQLARAGWTEGDIAKAAGIGQGEVRLILQLRK